MPTDTDGDGKLNISEAGHLLWLSGNREAWILEFEQDNDIDLSDSRNWDLEDHDNNPSTPDSSAGFGPIGNNINEPFSGKYYGNGHSISGVYINRPDDDIVSFFGYTDANAVIDSLQLTDIDFIGGSFVGGLVGSNLGTINSSSTSGNISGMDNLGGLVGINYGDIKNSNSEVNVDGMGGVGGLVGISASGMIEKSYFTGNVSGQMDLGGLVGTNLGSVISMSFSNSTVTGTENIGGLVGSNFFEIRNCYSRGDVTGNNIIGGLVGAGQGTLENCYSTGLVTGNVDVGGLVGFVTIINTAACYWDTISSGVATSATGLGRGTIQMQTQTNYPLWDFATVWSIDANLNDGYPYLQCISPISSIDEDNEIQSYGIEIYPNPVKNTFSISASKHHVQSFSMINISGKIVAQSDKINNFDISNIPNGHYTIIAELSNGMIVSKLIIKE
ncbi:MAG: hypothetical protein Kapaf2KO_21530 [Candidatus Kapaibacteriales bacterium]